MNILIVRPQQRGGVRHYFEAVEGHFTCDVHTVFMGRRTGEPWGFGPVRIVYDLLQFVWTLMVVRPDVVHLNPSFNRKSLVREGVYLLLLRLYSGRVLVFFHGWETSFAEAVRTSYLDLFRRVFKRADAFLVLAGEFKGSLREMGFEQPVHVETTVVDDTDLDVEAIQQHRTGPSHANTFRVLYLSRLVTEKGLLDLAEACHRCRTEHDLPVHLEIAGTGPDQEEMFARLERYDASVYTHHGYVTGEEKTALFMEGDLFALPTYYGEGLPISVLEAISFGLPVITTRAGGLSDQFVDGEHGFFVEPQSPDQIARYIRKLYNDRELYEDISLHNAEYARSRFWGRAVAERLENRYRALLTNE